MGWMTALLARTEGVKERFFVCSVNHDAVGEVHPGKPRQMEDPVQQRTFEINPGPW